MFQGVYGSRISWIWNGCSNDGKLIHESDVNSFVRCLHICVALCYIECCEGKKNKKFGTSNRLGVCRISFKTCFLRTYLQEKLSWECSLPTQSERGEATVNLRARNLSS